MQGFTDVIWPSTKYFSLHLHPITSITAFESTQVKQELGSVFKQVRQELSQQISQRIVCPKGQTQVVEEEIASKGHSHKLLVPLKTQDWKSHPQTREVDPEHPV
jgi:hypothetical protein